MRILTWNINGIRTIPQYHPWNTLKTHDAILDHLQADIVCFQEMKTSRQNLTKDVAVPPSYDSFFSFPQQKSGYSGVAVYTRAGCVVPCKAEEGITGVMQPKPPLTAAERVSAWEAYPGEVMPEAHDMNFRDLDSEGRALVLDFGLFVLINVYCPNDGTETEERLQYKMDFHRTLEARVKGLIEVDKREVIVVGDLNACAAVVDHCEGNLMIARAQAEGKEGDAGFWERDVRRWLRSWLISDSEDGGSGCLVDVVRRFWPDRKGMYTCWNTKISARESNYGTRIDYILATPGLLPWIKAADIQPEIKGSDHCPVFIDLHDQIVDASGVNLSLKDAMHFRQGTEPPRLAARFWDEYSGKQRLLDTFFGKKKADPTPVVPNPVPSLVPKPSPASEDVQDQHSLPSTSQDSSASGATLKRKSSTYTATTTTSFKKPKKDSAPAKIQKTGQASLAAFFTKPLASSSKSKPPIDDSDMLDADYRLALSLSQEQESTLPPPRASSSSNDGSKKAWTTLLAPIQPPKCIVHGEPTKEFTVNKPGPNKGKNFFICARPVGPGYDKGRAERLREEVDPAWRCDYFKWASEVRLEMTRKRGEEGFG